MFKMLGAATAAMFLGFAGAAEAGTVLVDFENYAVGDGVNAHPSGGRATFSGPGAVVSVGGNKALQLAAEPGYGSVGFPFQLSIYLPEDVIADDFSFDVYIPTGGVVGGYWLTDALYFDVPPGEWTTVHSRRFFYYSNYFFRGGNILVDNIRFNEEFRALPEPSTWATLIIGFGLTGGVLRRSRLARRTPLAQAS